MTIEEREERRLKFSYDMGVKLACHKERSIQQYLHCTKPDCNCCPKWEIERGEVKHAG